MSLATRMLHRSLALVSAALIVAGCSPDVGGGGDAVDEPPVVTNTSGFDIDTTGTFVVGQSPETASFSGGLTRNGKWIIRDGDVGTVVFASPARQVDFEMETSPLEGGGAKSSTMGLGKTTCGVGSQGLDDGAAFGGQLFLRGEFSDWNAEPEFGFYNFGDNIYQAEFQLSAGEYSYKIAQSEWDIFDRIVAGEDTLPTFTYVTSDPGPGGPNGNLVIPSDGCWNITLDATDTDNITLVVTRVELDDGGGGGGGKEECGVGNQGLDDTEAFGGQLFMRGAFSDWNAEPEYAFYNFGGNIYQAEFEIAAGEYQYKIAQSEWDIFDRIVAGSDTLPDTLYTTSDPGPGGPNGNLVIPSDGCWNVRLDAADLENITLIVTETELGGGGPAPFVGVEVRLFDSTGDPLDSEEFDASEGPLDLNAAFTQPGSDPAIGRIEIQSIGGAGDVLIDNFTWSVNPRDVPGAGVPTEVVYHRPDGDYTDTVIVYEGESYACTPGALGCVATITALPNSTIQFTVERGGTADPTGTFTANVGPEGESVYAFSGNPEAVSGTVGVAPADNEVLLFYQREDGNYDGWTVHLFPTGQPDWTNYNPGLCTVSGVDPVLGGYFLIKLPPQPCYDANPPALDTFPSELGFIIHKGDEKDPGPDQFIRISEQGNVVFVVSGVNSVDTAPPSAAKVGVSGRAAHWIDRNTMLWRPAAGTATVQLAWSADGTIGSGIGELDGNYEVVTLAEGTNPEPDNQRHLVSLPAWDIPGDVADNAKTLAGYQLVAIGRDRFDVVVDATSVQIPGLLDDLYAAEAAEVPLGVDWSGGAPTVRVWAPTADPVYGVTLNLYSDSSGTLAEEVAMTLDPDTGVWSATGSTGWDRMFYDFTLRVWSYAVDQFVVNRVTDPWSISLSADSRYSQIVNLDDPDLKPAGWDTLSLPTPSQPEDVVLYELHMRDFSVHDPSVPDALRGKYGAFALDTTAGHDHLQALADAGLTHVHILPAFDIATVQERRSDRVELEDPVDDLCTANPAAAGLCPTHSGKSIGQLLEEITADNPVSEQQQEIVGWLRNLDGFNWGYDPWHFGVPEGSYATDPDGVARIIEFREMVQGLAEKGLRTVMDVVYNHTNAGGQSDRSVLDRIVPGYYQRYNERTGAIETSTCCANTATEFAMMEKLMADTLETFTRDYKVGGFRFDLMGHQPKAAMLRIKDRLQALDPGMFLYGEGWDFGEVGGDRRFEQATQVNMAGTGIATFTDRMRDAIRGGGPFDTGAAHVATQGFITGSGYDPNDANRPPTASFVDEALLSADQIRVGMAGSLQTFTFEDYTGETVTGADVSYGGAPTGYVDDPSEVINYSAAHDNETLWDISQHKHPVATTLADRVRAHNLGIDTIVLAQGVPFVHAGQDLLRSKSMDRNSFDSGDWFNKLDLTFGDNNWRKGLPPRQDNQASWPQAEDALLNSNADATPAEIAFARDHFREMLQVRKSTVLYRLPDATEINNRVSYFNTGAGQVFGVIAQGIEGCSTSDFVPEYGYVMTIINANDEAQNLDFGGEFAGQDFQLHPVLVSSVDPVVQGATFDSGSGTFFVPARTTAVFTRAEQGSCSPFGEDIYLRGSFNDWADPPPPETQFDYDGGTGYELAIDLSAGDYAFKIAGATWSTDCGAVTAGDSLLLDTPYTMTCSGSQNLAVTIAEGGTHLFSLDASNPEAPVLTVSRPPYAVPIFVRGFDTDWGLTNRMDYIGGDEYLAVVDLTGLDAGNRTFKIASEDWATVNCGTPGDGSAPTAELGSAYPMACGDGTGDLELVTSELGQYSFLVDASDPANPTVTVTAPPYGQGVTVFVRGLNNDWGTTNPMNFTGDGKYRATVPLLALGAGDTSFKIASEDWATVNCGVPVDGTDTTVAPGESYVTGCGDGTGDITLDTDVLGNYGFWLDAGESTSSPTLTVTGP